jgi:cytochrome c oxidase assembly factor CtaG
VGWSFDPVQLAPVALMAALYARRAQRLRRRGRRVPPLRIAAFAGGLAALVLALCSPVDALGEERLFSAHMAQHVLIGDVAPLLLVLGLTRPLIRPLLALPGTHRLRVLAHPLVAHPLWAVDLCVWHLRGPYDLALDDDLVHALEHACFFAGGILLWTSLLALLPQPRWFMRGGRILALAGVWVVGGALANVFLWSGHPFYPRYEHAPRTWGLSPLDDQRAGGGVMLLEMMLVGIVVFVAVGLEWLRAAEDDARREAGHAHG